MLTTFLRNNAISEKSGVSDFLQILMMLTSYHGGRNSSFYIHATIIHTHVQYTGCRPNLPKCPIVHKRLHIPIVESQAMYFKL